MNLRRRLFWSLAGTYLTIFTGIAGLVLLMTTVVFQPPISLLVFAFFSLGLAATAAGLGTAWLFAGRISQEINGLEGAPRGSRANACLGRPPGRHRRTI